MSITIKFLIENAWRTPYVIPFLDEQKNLLLRCSRTKMVHNAQNDCNVIPTSQVIRFFPSNAQNPIKRIEQQNAAQNCAPLGECNVMTPQDFLGLKFSIAYAPAAWLDADFGSLDRNQHPARRGIIYFDCHPDVRLRVK